jgi:hypothetical protein
MSIAHKAAQAATSPVTTTITGENIVYLMGLSFIVGSLFTIFILVLLDFMRRDKSAK